MPDTTDKIATRVKVRHWGAVRAYDLLDFNSLVLEEVKRGGYTDPQEIQNEIQKVMKLFEEKGMKLGKVMGNRKLRFRQRNIRFDDS